MAKKETYHHGDLRQTLIAEAIALIAEQDVGRVSLREVARRVGVSHAAPYRHFADKEALLAAVAEEGFRGLMEAMQAAIDGAGEDPLRQVEATGIGYIEWGLSHPSHYRVMFGACQGSPDDASTLTQTAGAAFHVLLGAIAQAQAAGLARPEDMHQMGCVAWSLVHGLVMLALDNQLPPEQIAALVPFATRSLIEGFAAR